MIELEGVEPPLEEAWAISRTACRSRSSSGASALRSSRLANSSASCLVSFMARLRWSVLTIGGGSSRPNGSRGLSRAKHSPGTADDAAVEILLPLLQCKAAPSPSTPI